tara:strand:- start:198 stop:1253 length:1056 start_codon:yes stop_codon:yes gene_type:complete
MKKINIEISNNPTCYDIIIAENLISEINNFIPNKSNYSKFVLLFDSNIDSKTIDTFKAAFNNIICISVNCDSNNKKSFELFLDIQKKLIEYNIDRDSLILSLGGGTIGDLVGFVASTYKRGIDYIQIPTTLLAMLDSSIGGKTGIDSKAGKNLIGTFYHPKLVFIDTFFLSTLQKEEITSGVFEAIKYGVALDLDLFSFIKTNQNNIYDIAVLKKIIELCCQIKTNIITKDERDEGIRNKLNFGHTIGHAIESLYGIRHGEAVAFGMICAAYISKNCNTIDKKELDQIIKLITYFDLPRVSFECEKILEYILRDKKQKKGKNNFILLNGIGNSYISSDIEKNLIKDSILSL